MYTIPADPRLGRSAEPEIGRVYVFENLNVSRGSYRACKFQNFSGGAYPHTPLGGVALRASFFPPH